MISCPICGNREVVLLPSSMAILGQESRSSSSMQSETPSSRQKVFMQIQEYITKNFDNVGDRFAKIALRIHHGEEERRNIRGTATENEEKNLFEEGVEVIKIPMPKFDG
jgi:hypothetical protein